MDIYAFINTWSLSYIILYKGTEDIVTFNKYESISNNFYPLRSRNSWLIKLLFHAQ